MVTYMYLVASCILYMYVSGPKETHDVLPLQGLHGGQVPAIVLSGQGLVLLVDPGVGLITQLLEVANNNLRD